MYPIDQIPHAYPAHPGSPSITIALSTPTSSTYLLLRLLLNRIGLCFHFLEGAVSCRCAYMLRQLSTPPFVYHCLDPHSAATYRVTYTQLYNTNLRRCGDNIAL